MPYDRCETCNGCILSVDVANDMSKNELVLVVTCKNAQKCIKKEEEQNNEG